MALVWFKDYIETLPILSGAVIAEGDLIGRDPTTGRFTLADADAATPIPAVGVAVFTDQPGVTTRTGNAGGTNTVSAYREALIDGQSLTIGKSLYLSGTAGAFTETCPTTTAKVAQIVGESKTAAIAKIRVAPPLQTIVDSDLVSNYLSPRT